MACLVKLPRGKKGAEMYGVTKEQTIKFMQHIVETNGNPSVRIAKECNLEGFFCELCMRNISREHLVNVANKYLKGVTA